MGLISCKLQGRVFLKISHVNLLSKNEVFLSTVESYFGVVLHHVIPSFSEEVIVLAGNVTSES